MKLQQLKALMRINLLYVNPSATTQSRKKGKKGAALTRNIFLSYLLSGVVFLAVYTATMFAIDFSKFPGFFTYYLALFGLIGFSQAMSSIFNVFFESKDLENYLPLPFRQGEVFLAKFLVVGLTIVPFLLPLVVLFYLAAWRGGMMIVLAVLAGLIIFVGFVLLLFGLCSLVIFGLTQTKIFYRHKKTFMTGMMGLSMVLVIGGILIINFTQTDIQHSTTMVDRPVLTPFLPFYYVLTNPFSLPGFLSLLGILICLTVVFFIIQQKIVPKLYDQFSDENQQTVSKKRKRKENQNLVQLLRSYNLQLIKNPNLITQMLSSSLIMPVVFFITFMVTGQFSFQHLSPAFFGVFFCAGIFLAAMTINQTSLISSIISLDRENFLFIRSLPLSFREYLRIKMITGTLIQFVITGGVALLAGVFSRMPLLLLLFFVIGALCGTYLFCVHFFIRDYDLLNLNWNNVGELFTRGNGNFAIVFWMFGVMIVGGILLTLYVVAVLFKVNPFLLNGAVFLVLATIAFLYLNNQKKYFWQKLMD
ncbi:ABC transporter [Enterococcus florum]|uniref:ABC transporter n=1 Tax=Enterococcus florum TaxID=2480627 RepID=A0A4V0WPZ2_9ENTE|nr:ABC transporter [Enterococcus florum]GCF95549.1 ABC transporter [Enterococcus florum]